jgi:predicted RNA binding protein YcfA (HicA-like mRNA interferase family)
MAGGLPAISGVELIALLKKDGWTFLRDSKHGDAYTKNFPSGPRVTTIQRTSKSLAPGTLSAILRPSQTGLGRRGLERLLRRYRR